MVAKIPVFCDKASNTTDLRSYIIALRQIVQSIQQICDTACDMLLLKILLCDGILSRLLHHTFDHFGQGLHSVNGFGTIIFKGFANALSKLLWQSLDFLLEFRRRNNMDQWYGTDNPVRIAISINCDQSVSIGLQALYLSSLSRGMKYFFRANCVYCYRLRKTTNVSVL